MIINVNLGSKAFAPQLETVQNWAQGGGFTVVECPNTFEVRQFLQGNVSQLPVGSQLADFVGTQLPDAIVIGYDPVELWSLIVLLSHLHPAGETPDTAVVLIAEGPSWTLPVLVTDYPQLFVVPPGTDNSPALMTALDQAMARSTALASGSTTGITSIRSG